MWKNWIPFRRKHKEEDLVPTNHVSINGKENSGENTQPLTLPLQKQREGTDGLAGGMSSWKTESMLSGNDVLQKYPTSKGSNNVYPLSQENEDYSSSNARSILNRTLPSNLTSGRNGNIDRGNQSFTAVHGPLLSTPIMPTVRRVIETNAGLRSPGRPSLLSRGKPVGRSHSLNYGSSNPAKSRAGQVPWVRLKRRESLGLADYISGRTPQSPNTVKLAPPESSGLPPAPSFRSTPLIVTTEQNRSRILDTQTVVSALREKRKRFGESQVEESISEDISWQKSPKRRRQDSSQSNASSVSIPPMPDTLPNLIATPGTSSMIHIEHLSNQRPSTIPAVDVFSNHKTGLGGEQVQQQVLNQIQDRSKSDLNNSRLAQKALQSSLSSSLRARYNLSMLERGGVDLKRIRDHSSNLSRRVSNASTLERIRDEPQAKTARTAPQTPPNSTIVTHVPIEAPLSTTVTTFAVPSSTPLVSTVSAPTKRKIAEGVMLRKQNMSMNSPVQPLKSIPSDGMMSTSDYEKDKQKEYQRRVLDLLRSEEKETVTPASSGKTSQAPVTSVSTVSSLLTAPITHPVSASCSADTSLAISASLDSLNKLVQSTTSAAPPTLGTLTPTSSAKTDKPVTTSAAATSISSLSSSGFNFGGNLVTSTPAQPASNVSSVASNSLATALQTVAPSVTSTSALSAGFSFGLPPQPSLPSYTASLSLSSGFQVSFGSAVSSTPAVATNSVSSLSTPVAAPSSSSALPTNNLFNFGAPASSSSVVASSSGGFNFSANPTGSGVATILSQSVAASVKSPGTTLSQNPPNPQPPAYQFGVQTSTVPNSLTSNTSANTPKSVATAAQPGGFTFGAVQTTSNGGGFQFGATTPQSSTVAASTSSAQQGLFNFGAPNQTASQPSTGGFNFSAQPSVSAAPSQPLFGALGSSMSNVSSSVPNSNSVGGGFQFSTSVVSSTNTSAIGTGGFTFNASQPQSNTALNASQAPAPSIFTNQNPSGGFSFSQNTPATQPAAFNFGANASSKPSPFGAATSTSSVSQTLFGASTNPSGNQKTFGTASVSAPANAGLFQFGAPPSTATAALSPFGSATTSSTTNPSPFGTATGSSVSQSLFNFGATNPTSTAASVFGSTTNSTPANQSPFGSVNPTPFGAAAPKPSIFGAPALNSSVFSPASTQSIFGAAPANSFGTNVTSAGFGSSATLTTAPAFGSTTPSNQPFTFGVQPSSTVQPTAAFGNVTGSVFGGANTASSTGATSSVFGNTAPAGGSMFGGMNQATTSTNQPSMFGSSATSNVFGASQPAAPAFGLGQGVFGSTNSSTPAFGAAPNQQAAAPVFGAGAQNSQPNSTTPFGGTNVFGAAKPNPNPFGAPASTTQVAGFVFTASQSGQNTASPFGAQTASTASSGFNFGQATPQTPNQSGAFNFSAQSPAPTFPTPNPGGFNFNAGAGSTPNFNFSATPNTPNMFTPQAPGHRPRVATRRPQRRGRR